MRRLIWTALVLFAAHAGASAADVDPQVWFARAAESYDAGQYGLAAAQYDSLLEWGYRTSEVYFNLGNAFFRAGFLGHAIWAYRCAQQLSPRDPDIEANLTVARLASRDRIEPTPPGFVQQVWRTASGLLSLGEGARLVTLLWLGLWLGIAVALFLPAARRWVLPAVRLLALAWLLSAATFTVRFLALRHTQSGVVTAGETQARSAPDPDEDIVFTGHAGLECVVRGQRSEFLLIELANGRVGWVPASDLKLVDS